MEKINSIYLKSTITILRQTTTTGFDVYGKPNSGFTKIVSAAAIFPYSNSYRDNFKKDVEYDTVIYSKKEVQTGDMIYFGEIVEVVTDITSYKTYEVQKIKEMLTVGQSIVGYKIWL